MPTYIDAIIESKLQDTLGSSNSSLPELIEFFDLVEVVVLGAAVSSIFILLSLLGA